MKRFIFMMILLAAVSAPGLLVAQRLWYDRPARHWEETLPLGNGRLGMMPDGGIESENIVLNEITLWSGARQNASNPNAASYLPEIRSLLTEGRNEEAEALINKNFVCTGEGSGRGSGATVPFGCYQVLGNLTIKFDYHTNNPKPANYKRSLSVGSAVADCSFDLDGVTYYREYLTSFGNDVSIVKLSSNKKGKVSCSINLSRPEKYQTRNENNMLIMSGQLTNGTDGLGMMYKAEVGVSLIGGKINSSGNLIRIEGADEAILYISAATNFKSVAFEQQIRQALNNALGTAYSKEKKNHTDAFQKFFNRVHFSLQGTSRDSLPTDRRLEMYYAEPARDLAIVPLFFQFGRYLSICSTRQGLLPPNLQGLWANQIQTPWNGDYHLDVNVQMNHWPLEVTNLSELNLPLRDLVKGMISSGEKTAEAYYNADGWVAHVITNIWGFTEPGEDASWGSTNSGSGWLCSNLWDHYLYTLDRTYLESIYPILKGSAEFYLSNLIEEPDHHWMVTAPSVSPENSFVLPNGKTTSVCMGPTIDNQIIRELFSHVVEASAELNSDVDFRNKLKAMLLRIPPVGRVGSDGRLMEWLKEYKETEPQHRHVSHLYGLFPASLITESTPELLEACRKTLETRGDDSPGWSKAYKILFWSRLHDGNRAYSLFKQLLRPTGDTQINYGGGGGSYLNLLSAGPPFQIDGNFGGTAGLAEMLIQSHAGYIELLPAIPGEWKSGTIKGLRARGNFTVDFTWTNGRVTSYKIFSPEGRKVMVKINGEKIEVLTNRI